MLESFPLLPDWLLRCYDTFIEILPKEQWAIYATRYSPFMRVIDGVVSIADMACIIGPALCRGLC